jgi:DNA polymerase-3 subunit delta
MAQKKAYEVDRWLARPDPAVRLVLIYGPDRGLVSERARSFAGTTGLALDDPFSVIRLDASEVESQPGRLQDEARMVPMFAASRLIWIGNAGTQKNLAEEVRRLAQDPPQDAIILVEAGDLRKKAPLRAAVEDAVKAMALPCYADEGRALDSLIDEAFSSAGVTIALDAREALKANLGGDRLASRGEIAKLVLYCLDKGRVELEDVRLMVGDVSASSNDDAVDAVLAGKPAEADAACARFVAAGGQPFLLLGTTMRQFQALHLMRGEMDRSGKTAGAAVAAARPPVFFSRRSLVEGALQRWSGTAVGHALSRLQDAVLQTRRRPELAASIARRTLIALAIQTGAGSRP